MIVVTRPRAVTLDAFTTGTSTYGTLQGVAPGAINFSGREMGSIRIDLGQTASNSVTVKNTPGGGMILVNDLTSATVLGTAAGQLLYLSRAVPAPTHDYSTVTVDFSTGRVGAHTQIVTSTEILNVKGASPTDSFTGLTRDFDGTSIGYDEFDIDEISLSNGKWIEDFSPSRINHIALHVGPAATVVVEGVLFQPALLSIDAGSRLVFSPEAMADSPAFLIASSLSVAGTLDLMNNVLETSLPLDQIRALVIQGVQGESGIISSRADSVHGLGYGDGLSPSKVRLTLYGDANLDGKVDFSDLLITAQNYGKADAFWSQGDFNYDGKVGFDDLLKLVQNFGRSLTVANARRGVFLPGADR